MEIVLALCLGGSFPRYPRTVKRRCMLLPVVRIPWVPLADCLYPCRG